MYFARGVSTCPAGSADLSLRYSLHTASKHSIDTGAGVIDADYRGTVKVLLFNLSDVDFQGGQEGFPFCLSLDAHLAILIWLQLPKAIALPSSSLRRS